MRKHTSTIASSSDSVKDLNRVYRQIKPVARVKLKTIDKNENIYQKSD